MTTDNTKPEDDTQILPQDQQSEEPPVSPVEQQAAAEAETPTTEFLSPQIDAPEVKTPKVETPEGEPEVKAPKVETSEGDPTDSPEEAKTDSPEGAKTDSPDGDMADASEATTAFSPEATGEQAPHGDYFAQTQPTAAQTQATDAGTPLYKADSGERTSSLPPDRPIHFGLLTWAILCILIGLACVILPFIPNLQMYNPALLPTVFFGTAGVVMLVIAGFTFFSSRRRK
ncbi:hypothetical protein QS713_07370 [Gleimia hominis]|uniref:Uncharacterized protein n=1 Tax=Gleimia hominis TaxID=595468 RepID=A0ABU3IBX3_9ACTO|nr:hypothetical protein [Gleimia hominis]MDT3767878.1 hypothetical protein [Gleimia hominis]